MKKNDISQLIQRMKLGREETPNIAQTPAHPDKAQKSAVESIKEAKMHEFPIEPVEAKKPRAKKSGSDKAPVMKEKAPKPVAVKKSKGDTQDAEAKPKSSRPAKGSPEMKARMDAIRAKKGKLSK
jgi:hypothetical protein